MNRKITIFIAGDSTAATKQPDKKPETGWGERLPDFFTDQVEFDNKAANGRSSKSFINEGRLQQVAEAIREGDFFFIQFGHNDEKPKDEVHTDPSTTYKDHLTQYIEVAKKAGAHPVLLNSIHRRAFDEAGRIKDSHGSYPSAVRELAAELSVPFIDMTERSRKLLEETGEESSQAFFLWLQPGEHPNYPEGVQDNTHFSEKGALEMARLVADGIRELQLQPLVSLMK
jgi:lysophospholipase L1-like esterase